MITTFSNIRGKTAIIAGTFLVTFLFAGFFAGAQNPTTAPVMAVMYNGRCPVVTTFLKRGGNNDWGDVVRLQNFLRNYEGLNITITGEFDAATESAVVAFQKKYANVILAPWGTTHAPGTVYLTTIKQINHLACGAPLALTQGELAIIDAWKRSPRPVTVATTSISTPTPVSITVPVAPVAQDVPAVPTVPTQTITIEIGDPSQPSTTEMYAEMPPETNYNVALTGNPTLAQRFGRYVVNLFR